MNSSLLETGRIRSGPVFIAPAVTSYFTGCPYKNIIRPDGLSGLAGLGFRLSHHQFIKGANVVLIFGFGEVVLSGVQAASAQVAVRSDKSAVFQHP